MKRTGRFTMALRNPRATIFPVFFTDRFRKAVLVAALVCGLWAGGTCPCPAEGPAFDFGFVTSRDTPLDGSDRLRALGPFFENRAAEDGRTLLAFRPIFSLSEDPANRRVMREFLWPLGASKDFQNERFWRFLLAWGHDFETAQSPSQNHNILFPIVFWGRNRNLDPYFALFPLGGKIHEFLGRDTIHFALFPLYSHSTVGDVESHSVLWPFVSWMHGPDVSKVRVFPFYGKYVSGDRATRQFILWPIWTKTTYNYSNSKGYGYVLFPLFGRVKLTDQRGWMVLPPFFRWSKGEKRREVVCPWPFVQYSSGDVDKFYLWPLWGRKRMENVRSSFLLWPLGHREQIQRKDSRITRLSMIPFIFAEKRELTADSGETDKVEVVDVTDRYFKLWPLLSYQRQDDTSRFRMLDLWPLKHTAAIERNMAPLWTLYSRTRVQDASDNEFLWGLFRLRRDGQGGGYTSLFPLFSSRTSGNQESRKWSFLLGLAGYEREGLRKTYRLLYFLRFSRGGNSAPGNESATEE